MCVALLSKGSSARGVSNPELLRPLNRMDYLPLRLETCDVPLHMCSTQARPWHEPAPRYRPILYLGCDGVSVCSPCWELCSRSYVN